MRNPADLSDFRNFPYQVMVPVPHGQDAHGESCFLSTARRALTAARRESFNIATVSKVHDVLMLPPLGANSGKLTPGLLLNMACSSAASSGWSTLSDFVLHSL